MYKDQKFKVKLNDREILNLDEKELKQIERYNESFQNRELAEAKKEFNKQLRYIFEKAPPETIPFLVYSIYVVAAGLSGIIIVLSKFQGIELYLLIGLLVFILILPLWILPTKSWKNFINWLKFLVKKKKVINEDKNGKLL